jgi:hypothetical protein
MFSFHFYFNQADTIGSLADWMMVLVTIVTAVFLILTFRSQQIVQKAQQHITLIENERYRLEHLPVFDVSITTEPFQNDIASALHFYLNLKVILLKHNAHNVSAIFECAGGRIEEPYDKAVHAEIVVSENYIQDFDLDIAANREQLNTGNIVLHITLKFEDLIGNRYEQDFNYTFGFSNSSLEKDVMPTYLAHTPKS